MMTFGFTRVLHVTVMQLADQYLKPKVTRANTEKGLAGNPFFAKNVDLLFMRFLLSAIWTKTCVYLKNIKRVTINFGF